MTRPADIAQQALGMLPAGADAHVRVVRERSLLSRFAASQPTQATSVDDTSVSVLVVEDGHAGAATTNDLSPSGLRDAGTRAHAAARAAALAAGTHGSHPGAAFEQSGPAGEHGGFDLATSQPDPSLAGGALADVFETCREHGSEAFGIWTAGRVSTAIAASSGALLTDDVTDAYLKVIARDATTARTGWGAAAAVAAGTLDARATAARAARGVSAQEPRDVSPGEHTVVLLPDAVGALMEELGRSAFDGLANAEGRGALVDRLGTRIADPQITLEDDPAAAFPRAFDTEGTPKRPLTLIDAGVARELTHDLESAALAGTRSTGHALPPGLFDHGPGPTNLVLRGGSLPDLQALIAGVERGLLVTRLWYLNLVHERSALLTGTTRDGTFVIEDGEIAGPAVDVRFTDSPLRILDATEALTSGRELVCDASFYGPRFAYGTVAPALRAQGFRVTGASPR